MQRHGLVDAHTPQVAGATTLQTAHRLADGVRHAHLEGAHQLLPGRLVGAGLGLAVRAERAHQALGHDADHGGGDQIGRHAQVRQPGDRRGGVVGVQGGEHQVAGERRLDRHVRGGQVADLTDHDDVRILAQHRLDALGEAHLDVGLHLHLIEAGLHHFDRVLDGADVHFAGGQLLEGGIERGGLARAGRAGDEHDAVGVGGHRLPVLVVLLAEAELRETAHQHVRVEHPHHHLFAEGGGQGGDTQLHFVAVRGLGLQAAVLGFALLGHVQPRQDLQPAGDRRHDGGRQLVDVVQHAVDAEAHLAQVPARLQVDVTGALGKRVLQNPVDDIDDVLVVGVRVALAHFQQLLEVGNAGQLLAAAAGGAGDRAAQVVELDAVAAQLLRVGEHHLQGAVAQHLLEMLLPVRFEGLIAGHHHPVAVAFHGDDAVPFGERVAHHPGDLIHIHLERVDVIEGQAAFRRQPVAEEFHVHDALAVGAVHQTVLGHHLQRVPVEFLVFPGRGGNNVELFPGHALLVEQFAHYPANVHFLAAQMRGNGAGIHGGAPPSFDCLYPFADYCRPSRHLPPSPFRRNLNQARPGGLRAGRWN